MEFYNPGIYRKSKKVLLSKTESVLEFLGHWYLYQKSNVCYPIKIKFIDPDQPEPVDRVEPEQNDEESHHHRASGPLRRDWRIIAGMTVVIPGS